MDGAMGGCGWGAEGGGRYRKPFTPNLVSVSVLKKSSGAFRKRFLCTPLRRDPCVFASPIRSHVLRITPQFSSELSSVQLSSAQEGIDPLGKTHMRYTASLRSCFSFPVLFWKHFVMLCVITVYKQKRKKKASKRSEEGHANRPCHSVEC